MLAHISISNYTIVSSLEMEFSAGMTVITGETGAGKSIMLDALGLCLGDRADSKAVRHGCQRAEIIAGFALAELPQARAWLHDRDLHTGDECLLRRVITVDGRSRAYINGSVSTLQDCAELGAMLIDIHSQHAHQSLLRKPMQRDILDAYAAHKPLTQTVEQCASDWLRKRRELELLAGAKDEHTSRTQLLAYQVEELDTLDMQDNELQTGERELKLLANAEEILHGAHQALELCENQDSGVNQALNLLDSDVHATQNATEARELLKSAAIALSEARSEIQQHIDSVEIDPERLAEVQRRLESIYDIARKHRVVPERLADLHQALKAELKELADGGQRIEELQQQMEVLSANYITAAARLTKQRRSATKKLVKAATKVLSTLAMEQCQFEIALVPLKSDDPHPHGSEEVEFLISTNPGAPTRPLGKIASGGELSRISLAIQVVTANTGTVPSMVFDEVDVGIGGAVAEVVGKLLRTLAERAQVLCVTHLAQVAAQGNQHLQVTKSSSDQAVETTLRRLKKEQKVQEIARMIGGVKITKQTLAHAREMLEN
ncbi:MAG: DNA repair protein RecN [Halioglobus sp.]|nr:DNA repair protein RecN [Halioglobus sp.]